MMGRILPGREIPMIRTGMFRKRLRDQPVL